MSRRERQLCLRERKSQGHPGYPGQTTVDLVPGCNHTIDFDFGVLTKLSDHLLRLNVELSELFGKVPMLFRVAHQTNYNSIDNLSNIELKFKSFFDLHCSLNVVINLPKPNPTILAKGLEALTAGKLDVSVYMGEVMADLVAHGQDFADSECLARTRSVIPNS